MEYKKLLKLVPYAYSLTRNRDDAHDLVQDTAVRILEKNIVGDDEALLKAVMRNLFIDKMRKTKRRRSIEIDMPDADTVCETDFLKRLEDNELIVEVFAAIDKINVPSKEQVTRGMKPSTGDALIMVRLLGLSYKQLAAAMKTNINTALGRVRYADKSLRKILND